MLFGYFEPQPGTGDLMLFSAYFDGSGKIHDVHSEHVVLAGVVFYAEKVGEFAPMWVEKLKLHSQKAKKPIVKYFHAKDAFRCKGQFDGWTMDQVNDLLTDLAGLTRDRCYTLFCAPANKASYKALPEKFRHKLQGVNELSFEVCVNELLRQLGPDDRLHIACDDEEDEAPRMYKFLCRYKQRYPARRDKFAAICFADDRQHPVLQAADFLAYVQRQEWDRKLSGCAGSPNPLIKEFTANGSEMVEYEWTSDGDGLGSAKRIAT